MRNYQNEFYNKTNPFPGMVDEKNNPYASTMGATGGLGATDDGGFNWKEGVGALLGEGIGSLFGGSSGPDPMSYLSKISGAVSPYLKPYSDAGQSAMGDLSHQYENLLSDPAGFMANIGKKYQQSPGLHFAIQQALQGAGHSAAAGGMAGSPMAQQQAEKLATNLGQQDYYNWLNKAMGAYGQGLSGEQGLAKMGLEGGMGLSQALAQALSAQAQEAQEKQGQSASDMGGILGAIGSIIGKFGL